MPVVPLPVLPAVSKLPGSRELSAPIRKMPFGEPVFPPPMAIMAC